MKKKPRPTKQRLCWLLTLHMEDSRTEDWLTDFFFFFPHFLPFGNVYDGMNELQHWLVDHWPFSFYFQECDVQYAYQTYDLFGVQQYRRTHRSRSLACYRKVRRLPAIICVGCGCVVCGGMSTVVVISRPSVKWRPASRIYDRQTQRHAELGKTLY